ncbi:glycine betaine transporter [Desulfocicer vacuolatum DSM 3385]|uniref:Glycine betaine transporter n=1 Tax=Desulfocicer vacuolatum DSM 3385 TaxID=1121400 RepID=A0A1W2DPW5_9BACT|nr:BCCT family transporter [Desulfocicer vacuolatum]SMC99449.1 glycine betaine transporter [Desulfocicer vacuolatum DSM 3385]
MSPTQTLDLDPTDQANADKGGFSKILGNYDPMIFFVTGAVTLFAVIYGFVAPQSFDAGLSAMQSWITSRFSWFFILSVALYLGIIMVIAFSKYGNLKLGKETDTPEFSYISWIAMLFSCGVGVGYAFWAVGEPIMHYFNTPYLAESATPAARPIAIQIGVMHWGIHAWGIFALVGLAIAFPAYRMGKPMNVSISLYGLFGDKITNSFLGRVIEILAAFATIAGVSTALGLGIMSTNAGIEHIFGSPLGTTGQLIFMAVLIGLYILSAVSGIDKGIKNLSTINIAIAFCWGAFILFSGPTKELLSLTVQTAGSYITNFVFATFWTDANGTKGQWLEWWTVFYWIWWISWGPFCGGFVARISKGRTIREFIIGVCLVPSIVAIVWFSIVGGAAQSAQIAGAADIAAALKADMGSGIYVLLSTYPMGSFMAIVVFLNLIIFLVTSADSASFFVAMQMSGGETEPNTPMKLIWGIFIGSLALVLLASGGLAALQKASIIAGAPFAIITFMMAASLFKMLHKACEDQ